jgi:lysozyme
MTPELRQKLRGLLLQHEGFRQFPYTDTTGHLTIGIGRNLDSRGISQNEAFILLDDDSLYFSSKLSSVLPFFDSLDGIRQIALVDMCFNLGVNGLLEFKNFLGFVEKKDWKNASAELLDSKAAAQCVDRYKRLAEIILTGVF